METSQNNLKEGKQIGHYSIPPEVLKRRDVHNIILEFANKLLYDNVKPEQWSKVDGLLLSKVGDLSDTGITEGSFCFSLFQKWST